MNNRAGYYKQNLSGEMAYKSFVPNPLPPVPPIELSEDIVGLLVKANSQLAVLEMYLSSLVDTKNVFCDIAFSFVDIRTFFL